VLAVVKRQIRNCSSLPALAFVTNVKYLGHLLTDKRRGDNDFEPEIQNLFVITNALFMQVCDMFMRCEGGSVCLVLCEFTCCCTIDTAHSHVSFVMHMPSCYIINA